MRRPDDRTILIALVVGLLVSVVLDSIPFGVVAAVIFVLIQAGRRR